MDISVGDTKALVDKGCTDVTNILAVSHCSSPELEAKMLNDLLVNDKPLSSFQWLVWNEETVSEMEDHL